VSHHHKNFMETGHKHTLSFFFCAVSKWRLCNVAW